MGSHCVRKRVRTRSFLHDSGSDASPEAASRAADAVRSGPYLVECVPPPRLPGRRQRRRRRRHLTQKPDTHSHTAVQRMRRVTVGFTRDAWCATNPHGRGHSLSIASRILRAPGQRLQAETTCSRMLRKGRLSETGTRVATQRERRAMGCAVLTDLISLCRRRIIRLSRKDHCV